MRRYFTWRCIGLHVLTLLLVPAFLLAGWWQYHVALSGNGLSWVYTVEWPVLAGYAVYMWWELIHDQHTPFDRFWAAKARAAADASGTPLYQIPGWAVDKSLSRAVVDASLEAARGLALSPGTQHAALGSHDQHEASETRTPLALGGSWTGGQAPIDREPVDDPASSGLQHRGQQVIGAEAVGAEVIGAEVIGAEVIGAEAVRAEVIDAEVIETRAVRDEALDAYNRYLAELNWKDPPKRGGSWRRSSKGGPGTTRAAPVPGPAAAVEKADHRELDAGDGGPCRTGRGPDLEARAGSRRAPSLPSVSQAAR
jgi:hypothetical protein